MGKFAAIDRLLFHVFQSNRLIVDNYFPSLLRKIGFLYFKSRAFPAARHALAQGTTVLKDSCYASISERNSPACKSIVAFLTSFVNTTIISPNKEWEYFWVMAKMHQHFRNRPKGKILDAGCGVTSLQFGLSHLGYQVFGIDSVEAGSGIWEGYNRHLAKFLNSRIDYKKNDIQTIDYPDNYFDSVMCISVIEHIRAVKAQVRDESEYCMIPRDMDDHALLVKIVSEMARVLKPGGIMLLTCDYYIPRDNFLEQANIDMHNLLKSVEHILKNTDSETMLPGHPSFDWRQLIQDSDVDVCNYNDRLQTSLAVCLTKRGSHAN